MYFFELVEVEFYFNITAHFAVGIAIGDAAGICRFAFIVDGCGGAFYMDEFAK
ncbi:Uncharacterised protein [Vibrio cholerae]|nr:Uncharacterised protein [Vibrio cholerae]